MNDKNTDKTAVVWDCGPIKYLRALSGLKTAPTAYERTMVVLLALMKEHDAIVYADNTTVFS